MFLKAKKYALGNAAVSKSLRKKNAGVSVSTVSYFVILRVASSVPALQRK